jgi:predicted AAA+ superfamily ATPase
MKTIMEINAGSGGITTRTQETASLVRIPDSFRKVVVVRDYIKPWVDENGIQYIGIEDFLLDEDILSH